MVLGKYGSNLQNVSDNLRRCYIPPKGKIFVQADQAGAEALIVAWLCKPGRNYRALFEHNIKPHVFTALHIFGPQWKKELLQSDIDLALLAPVRDLNKLIFWNDLSKEIRKNERRYFIGKKCVHAGNYREGVNTFVTSILTESSGKVLVTKKEAELFQHLYRVELFPEIPNGWWPEVEEQLRKTRTIYNLFGYPIEFTEIRITDEIIRKATAACPQSTVGTITNIAQVEIQNRVEDDRELSDVDVLNNKHDSILCQCDIGHEKEVATMMRSYIEKDLTNFRGEQFKMKSEAMAGYNWLDYDEETNLNGIKEIAA